jgi:hypothetical protein
MNYIGMDIHKQFTVAVAKFTEKPREKFEGIELAFYWLKLEDLCCNKNRFQAPHLESKIAQLIEENAR